MNHSHGEHYATRSILSRYPAGDTIQVKSGCCVSVAPEINEAKDHSARAMKKKTKHASGASANILIF